MRVSPEGKAFEKAVHSEAKEISDMMILLGVEPEPFIVRNVARWRVKSKATHHRYSEDEGRAVAIRNGAKRSLEFASRVFEATLDRSADDDGTQDPKLLVYVEKINHKE